MQEITRISSTAPQFIQRKLVLALVSYCLHCPWQSMVEEITGSLLNNLPILFEYLTMLPEEFTRTDLTKEHKYE